ncbi:hypothetical protein ACLB2K_052496 [Fragaria x ananassa]
MKKRRSHRERVLLPMRGHWTRAQKKERGITMSVAVAYFDSKKYKVVVLDSPGHGDFVPNMISDATQADAAILVVDGSHGAFDAGMKGGQTKEHAQIIKSFGVKQIVVAVNKMDVVGYSKDRFDEIKHTLGTYFSGSCRFEESAVCWVPLSAMENQNMVSAPGDERLLSWYSGPCLLEAIDSFQPPKRESEKSLLMPICDVIKSSRGQFSACGKLQAGTLQNGLKVRVMPSGELGTVRSLERDGSHSFYFLKKMDRKGNFLKEQHMIESCKVPIFSLVPFQVLPIDEILNALLNGLDVRLERLSQLLNTL